MNSLKFNSIRLLFYAMLIMAGSSCTDKKISVNYSFDDIPDRIWVGEDFWTVPIEDWQVKNGRVECSSPIQNATFSILPYVLGETAGDFEISLDMGLLAEGNNKGAAGIILGAQAQEEKDIRAAIYFGRGINLGVNTEGFAFMEQQTKQLPPEFDFNNFSISLTGSYLSGALTLNYILSDKAGNTVSELSIQPESLVSGIIQLANNLKTSKSANNGPLFWFDNLTVKGDKFEYHPSNRFGPVLWTMFTLSEGTLKLSAQLPPMGETENKTAELQFLENGKWLTKAAQSMDSDARTATYKIGDFDSSKDTKYRISFPYVNSTGNNTTHQYEGTIRKEPTHRVLRMGALTCQFSNGFPYSPLVKNLTLKEPDLLYFSGDQIYESNGGYDVKRSPEDVAILNYLGKWYMFGWAFGDLMRNTPTVCTPDDHDVYHGNLWGEGGIPFDDQEIINNTNRVNTSDLRGFAQTVRFVNMVNRTQCAHLPDPYDPTPIEQGMSVWYTNMKYGRVSFAIISDRIFKSAPESVSSWEGRNDHITSPLKDPSSIEIPGLEFLGSRQEKFLNAWIRDWNDVDMKVLLSQTVFANPATHHGTFDGYLYGDMDSGGWPKIPRDRAIRTLRKAFAFQISGDQHLPSMLQYGIENYRDAGWCYCTPAISIVYSRWFRPDELKIPVNSRPEHGHPNTGKYKDSFGNLNYVYAIGNPGNFTRTANRHEFEQAKSAGFGMVYFDQIERNITMESWRFLADVTNPGPDDQHPGWPLTISQFDNYGREAKAWLPTIKVSGEPNPVVEVINEKTGETEYIVRIKGNDFAPKVFSNDTFTIRIGYPEKNIWKSNENLKASPRKDDTTLQVSF